MTLTRHIPFNRPYLTGHETRYILEAVERAHLAGKGTFSTRCSEWLEREVGSHLALLTHSCTGALEMAFTLADIGKGDEVVMPSFTFVSTANAVVARGGTPVFVDIREDTLCLDAVLAAAAVTERTKAIATVHYAGLASDMALLVETASATGTVLIEDAAQAIRAEVDGRTLGGIGHLAALSFHETKNVSCGEGGALLVNDARFAERAQIVHDKGTDRSRFFRGQVDKYTWVDHGSSYVLSDLAAAYLWAQLERVDEITDLRLDVWHAYEAGLAELATGGDARLPIVPPGCRNNAHVFYLIVDDPTSRAALISALAAEDINAVFHYVPLHSSEAGRRFGRAAGELPVTDWVAERLVRLPLWAGMTTEQTSRVVEAVLRFFGRRG